MALKLGIPGHEMASPILEVVDLKKKYGRLEALKGVSFSVAEGELFGLLGPNGAGKTTLISILSCLLAPTSGSAKLGGQDLCLGYGSIRQQIGLVPQDVALYGELTARENLRFFGRLYGMKEHALDQRVEEVLDAIALADRANDRVQTFSGGMRRRLNLGASIMHEPRLLFLDEPTTGVDPQSRNRIFEEVRRLNGLGMTIIYTSHYMEEVQSLCTRVGILDHGELIAYDTVQNLLHRLEGQIVFRMDSVPEMLPARLQEVPGVKMKRFDGDRFELTCGDVPNALLRVAEVFVSLHVEPAHIEAHEPNLERVFLHLTGRALRD
jgi:linearmycin/streptolysin S transport system ATP-binding protein